VQGIYSKLQFAAIVLSLLGIIGGFTYTWGVFNNRLDVLENKDFVINQTVDLSDIKQALKELDNDLSVQIKFLESQIQQANVEIKINAATLDYLNTKLEEVKLENDNPLLNGLGL